MKLELKLKPKPIRKLKTCNTCANKQRDRETIGNQKEYKFRERYLMFFIKRVEEVYSRRDSFDNLAFN